VTAIVRELADRVLDELDAVPTPDTLAPGRPA
jgi:hypothetical protein